MFTFVILCALFPLAFNQLNVDFENQSLGQLTKCRKSKLDRGSSSVQKISEFDVPLSQNGQFACVISHRCHCLKSDFVKISEYSYVEIEYLTKDCDITNGCSLRVILMNKFRKVEEHLLPASYGKWHRFRKPLLKTKRPEDFMIMLRSSNATLILINFIRIHPSRSRPRRKRSMSVQFDSDDSESEMTSKTNRRYLEDKYKMGMISSLTEGALTPETPTTFSEYIKAANQWPDRTGSEQSLTENDIEHTTVSSGRENIDHTVNVNGMFATTAADLDRTTNNPDYFRELTSDVSVTETSNFSDGESGETKVHKLDISESSFETSAGVTPTIAIDDYSSDTIRNVEIHTLAEIRAINTHTVKAKKITTSSEASKQLKPSKVRTRSSCPVVTVNSGATVTNQPTELVLNSTGVENSGETNPSTVLDTGSVIINISGIVAETFDSNGAKITNHINFAYNEITSTEINNSSTDSADDLLTNGTAFDVITYADGAATTDFLPETTEEAANIGIEFDTDFGEAISKSTDTDSIYDIVTDKFVTDSSVTVTESFFIFPESTVDDLDIYIRTNTNESSESISSNEITVDDISTITSELSTKNNGAVTIDNHTDMDAGNDSNNGSTAELPLDSNKIENKQTILLTVDDVENSTNLSVIMADSTETSVSSAAVVTSSSESFQVVGSNSAERNRDDDTQMPVSFVEARTKNSIMSIEVGNKLTMTDFLLELNNTDEDEITTQTLPTLIMSEGVVDVIEESTELSRGVANFSETYYTIPEIRTSNTTLEVDVEPTEKSVLSSLTSESTLINTGVEIDVEAYTTGSTLSDYLDTRTSSEDLFSLTESTEKELGTSEYVLNKTGNGESRSYTTSETFTSEAQASSTLTEQAVDGDTIEPSQNITNFTETTRVAVLSTLTIEPRETVSVSTSKEEDIILYTTMESTETSSEETNSGTESNDEFIANVDSGSDNAARVQNATDSDAHNSTQKTVLNNEDVTVSTVGLSTEYSVVEIKLSTSLNSSIAQSGVSKTENHDAAIAITNRTAHSPVVNADVTTSSSSNVEEPNLPARGSGSQIRYSALLVVCVIIPTYFS